MRPEKADWCPLVKGKCKQFKCAWFTNIKGTDPQTGAEVDEWSCAMTWMPLLLVENSMRQMQTSSSIQSFRNDMVNQNEASRKVIQEALINNNNNLLEDSNGN